MTLFEKRQQMSELRNQRRSQGICIQCGQNETANNQDGTKSVRCLDCRSAAQQHKSRFRPQSVSELDMYDEKDYRDTLDFRRYVKQIDKLFATYGVLTTRLIHETLGYQRQAWTLTALGYIDQVEELGAQPTRYRKYGHVERVTPILSVPGTIATGEFETLNY